MIERYCACSGLIFTLFTNVFQILSTLANYGESAGRFKPIRNGETFLLCMCGNNLNLCWRIYVRSCLDYNWENADSYLQVLTVLNLVIAP